MRLSVRSESSMSKNAQKGFEICGKVVPDRATSDDLPQSDHNCDGGRLQLALEATVAVLTFLTQLRLDLSKSMATHSIMWSSTYHHIREGNRPTASVRTLEHSVKSDIMTTPRFGPVLS